MSTARLIITKQVEKFITDLSIEEENKARNIFRLFREYGQTLPTKYLKRISGTKRFMGAPGKKGQNLFVHLW